MQLQTLIKEYGETILAAIVTAAIIGLIFGGLTLIGKLGVITGSIDTSLVQDAEASSEVALRSHMNIQSDNIDMSQDVTVVCGRDIYYAREGSELIRLKKGSAKLIHISHVYLIEGDSSDNEGYDVTDQILHLDASYDDSYLRFIRPGNYRLVVSITDANDVVSDYQIFVTAVERRNV